MKKLKRTRPVKDLKLEEIRFGIEIEVEFPTVKDSSDLIEKHRLIRGWTLDYDGSLDNGAEYKPINKNKLYFNQDTFDQINEIIGLIKAHRGTIRPTCGSHVHIDTKSFTDLEIVKIVKGFISKQSDIIKKFKVLKSRLDYTACKIPKQIANKINNSVIKKIKSGEIGNFSEEYFTERHFALNLQSLHDHNTLEFRFFNGTIQSRKIKSYIKWCLNFCLANR